MQIIVLIYNFNELSRLDELYNWGIIIFIKNSPVANVSPCGTLLAGGAKHKNLYRWIIFSAFMCKCQHCRDKRNEFRWRHAKPNLLGTLILSLLKTFSFYLCRSSEHSAYKKNKPKESLCNWMRLTAFMMLKSGTINVWRIEIKIISTLHTSTIPSDFLASQQEFFYHVSYLLEQMQCERDVASIWMIGL